VPTVEDGAIRVLARGRTATREVLPSSYAKTAKRFLRRGDRGHVATVSGSFAGWMWLSRTSHRDPWSGLRFRLAPDEAYVYSMWVEPEFRPLGVGAMLMASQLSEVQRAGEVSRVYGWVDSPNREMQLLIRMVFGFEQVQTVRRARLLHMIGLQLPGTDEPKSGPVSGSGRHSAAG
jgi:ribosomal protein S18 acetylase RimI-like enzyme